MNGAESLLRTLVNAGVGPCFMNPGTSEIHLVSALDRVAPLRAVPCLFEGVASGAADGYARMTATPACTLFHLGPGLSNALANLHNACRAQVPMINLVGDHATFHRPLDPPLASDIETIARPFSKWLKSARHPGELGSLGAEAVAASLTAPGQIATLVVPADASWGAGGEVAPLPDIAAPAVPDSARLETAARLLRDRCPGAIILGARGAQGRALVAAGRVAAKTGAKLLATFAFSRLERGAGRPVVERIAYVTDQAVAQLRDFRSLILVGAPAPVSFFGHPTRPSLLAPEGCEVFTLAQPNEDCASSLEGLAAALDATSTAPLVERTERFVPPSGNITVEGVSAAIGAALPENAIVVDESITSGRGVMAATRGAPPHDWLVNTGGSIGIAIPLAVGAAIACPERPVLCLEGDGSAMYTLQALWTAARENLAITTVVFSNRSYAILKWELLGLGENPGPRALSALDISPPEIDFVALSRSLGVPAARAATIKGFSALLRRGLASGEPNLIEVPLS